MGSYHDEEPNMEVGAQGSLAVSVFRLVHHSPLPHVLRQQLVLHLPLPGCQSSKVQHSHPCPQQRLVLSLSNHRIHHFRYCSRQHPFQPLHSCQRHHGCAVRAHLCDLGWRLRLPEAVQPCRDHC